MRLRSVRFKPRPARQASFSACVQPCGCHRPQWRRGLRFYIFQYLNPSRHTQSSILSRSIQPKTSHTALGAVPGCQRRSGCVTGLRVALTPSRRDNFLARARPAPGRRSATSSAQRARLGCAPALRRMTRRRLGGACISPSPLRDRWPLRDSGATPALYAYPGLPAFASLSMAGSVSVLIDPGLIA
ncbi:hypothetical protein EDC35_107110 [Thiobaca trueperi]|uniref:Uncharacterized protein n=1 Tax=Thiobaca trueperi TaxID=127458 RepID=A0A4V6NZX0_9GAMM|nr:hypothetical protein EDC35_107110 [Thiobaca trueperi]